MSYQNNILVPIVFSIVMSRRNLRWKQLKADSLRFRKLSIEERIKLADDLISNSIKLKREIVLLRRDEYFDY
jgi:hypothetical protein